MSKDLNMKEASPIGIEIHGGAASPKTVIERWKKFKRRHRDGVAAYAILTPMLIYFLVFSILPVIFVIYLSFTEWNGMAGWPAFIGLSNYKTFFTNIDYIITLVRAGVYGFFILFFNVVIGFFIALLLNQKVRGVGLIRTIWYLPVLVPFAVVSQMMSAILNPVDGIVMTIMKKYMEKPIVFQESTFWMSFWIILICVWKGVGGTVIIYLAGLQSVDISLYEAARVDGANRLGLMWHVTLPSIRPITMFVLIRLPMNNVKYIIIDKIIPLLFSNQYSTFQSGFFILYNQIMVRCEILNWLKDNTRVITSTTTEDALATPILKFLNASSYILTSIVLVEP